jgi:hypothetical protein
MDLDIYYSSSLQDKYGAKNKDWGFDQTLRGYVETVSSEDKSKTFFEYKGKLVGRTKKDPRIDSDGLEHSVTDILITDIKDVKTGVEYYLETSGPRVGRSTLYELTAIEPFVDPFNRIEYWRIFLNKIDSQVLISNV